MPEFLAALQGYSGNILTRYATMLLIYTVPRTIELLTLKWANINFEQKLATIDEEVVKKDRVHLIPLATQAIEILKFLQPITGHGNFVFPNRNHPSKPMSNGAILHVIRRLGFANRASGHGFNRDWIEKQLNHEEGSVRGIYNHAQYLEGRRGMMQWYADYMYGLIA
ncbi:site-specific integrase [uncultured Gilliamella sp.]|uniref:tyrosine-type recombinase/integrase n=1 Tax=uncultured Gilliamella sp. TaxID=1193505 RepID=UPI0025FD0E2A|nr:site-specific integrase [uncultured Gilliamella sp.]